MNVKQGDYQSKPLIKPSKTFTNKFQNSFSIVHPKFVLFFLNLRYLVKHNYPSFSEFARQLKEAKGLNITLQTVKGYETGWFVSVQFNWLALIADFFNEDANEMMMYNFSERDANKAEQ